MAQSKKSKKPLDPTDFGDLGPIEAAPEDIPVISKSKKELKVDPPPPPKKEPPPPPEEIVLSADDVLSAIVSGDSNGLPLEDGFDHRKQKKELVISSKESKLTASIAGHAVACELVHEVRLVRWKVLGTDDLLSGKYRLMNETRMVNNGQVIILKAGKEFFDHQISVKAVERAGGIVLPIGMSH